MRLGSISHACQLVGVFFVLALPMFPAAAETASPPISGSNGLMGEWGANSPDSGRKPIGGLRDQHGVTSPGIPTETNAPTADAQKPESLPDAKLESSPPIAPQNVAPSPPNAQSESDGLIEWNSNGSAPQTGNDQQGITASDTPTELSPPSAGAQDAELRSSPPDTELESSPPSASREVSPEPRAQSSSNGLVEWNANNSASQTGASTDRSLATEPGTQPGREGPIVEGGITESDNGSEIPNDQQANLDPGIVAPDIQTELSPSSAPSEESIEATTPPASKVSVIIDKPTQKMKVYVDDVELYSWKVSSGLPAHSTPSGAFTASSMNEMWYSKEWDDAPMPHAIFFTKEGHAIHGTQETKKLGRPASHGCVRLAPENARTLFALVKEKGLENTEIVLNGDTPGGESRMAKTGPRKQQVNKRAKTRVYAAPPPRFGRREWRERRFSERWSRGFYWRY
jgi:lipoprotein-anchoring transpeptidase ErfK/SrfK